MDADPEAVGNEALSRFSRSSRCTASVLNRALNRKWVYKRIDDECFNLCVWVSGRAKENLTVFFQLTCGQETAELKDATEVMMYIHVYLDVVHILSKILHIQMALKQLTLPLLWLHQRWYYHTLFFFLPPSLAVRNTLRLLQGGVLV